MTKDISYKAHLIIYKNDLVNALCGSAMIELKKQIDQLKIQIENAKRT